MIPNDQQINQSASPVQFCVVHVYTLASYQPAVRPQLRGSSNGLFARFPIRDVCTLIDHSTTVLQRSSQPKSIVWDHALVTVVNADARELIDVGVGASDEGESAASILMTSVFCLHSCRQLCPCSTSCKQICIRKLGEKKQTTGGCSSVTSLLGRMPTGVISAWLS